MKAQTIYRRYGVALGLACSVFGRLSEVRAQDSPAIEPPIVASTQPTSNRQDLVAPGPVPWPSAVAIDGGAVRRAEFNAIQDPAQTPPKPVENPAQKDSSQAKPAADAAAAP